MLGRDAPVVVGPDKRACMSETKANESTETPKPAHTGPTAPPSIMTKPSDQAVRPGFRTPGKVGTKAQKAAKKK